MRLEEVKTCMYLAEVQHPGAQKKVPPYGTSRTGSRAMFFVRARLVLLLVWPIVSPSPNPSPKDRGTEQVLVT